MIFKEYSGRNIENKSIVLISIFFFLHLDKINILKHITCSPVDVML